VCGVRCSLFRDFDLEGHGNGNKKASNCQEDPAKEPAEHAVEHDIAALDFLER